MLRYLTLLTLLVAVCYAAPAAPNTPTPTPPVPTPDCPLSEGQCYDSWNGQYCVTVDYVGSLVNMTKHCRKCDPALDSPPMKRSYCGCGLGDYCNADFKDPHNYATCMPMTPLGQKCDPRVTLMTDLTDIQWGVNHKYFCGGLSWDVIEDSRAPGSNPRTILWRGACINGYCKLCSGGSGGQNADYDRRSCGDGASCFKHTAKYNWAGVYSWIYFGDNAPLFIQFWFSVIVGAIIVFSCLCLVVNGKFKKSSSSAI